MNLLQTALTPITRNLPSIIRDPVVAVIGERCYGILVHDANVTDAGCLKYALSKGLGLGIVVGGAIVKIPQIMKIVRSGSARGLSLSAYILETASYAVSLAYAHRNRFPFSTHGENFFLTIQNVAITLLILYYSAPRGASPVSDAGKAPTHASGREGVTKVITGMVVVVTAGLFLWSPQFCPLATLALLQAATLPISLLSKAPQIISNHRAKTTGNLSAFAVFNALLGCLARLFTTKQEVNDPLIFWGFAGAATLNAVLACQMLVYWKSGDDSLRKRVSEHDISESIPIARTSAENGTPMGRRWGRKLD